MVDVGTVERGIEFVTGRVRSCGVCVERRGRPLWAAGALWFPSLRSDLAAALAFHGASVTRQARRSRLGRGVGAHSRAHPCGSAFPVAVHGVGVAMSRHDHDDQHRRPPPDGGARRRGGWLVPAGNGTLGGGDTGRAREVRDLIQAGSSLIRDVVKSDSLGGAIGS